VKLILSRWGKTASDPRLHALLCRHSFATYFLTEKCGDVFRLKLILGHSTLEMATNFASYREIAAERVAGEFVRVIGSLEGFRSGRKDAARLDVSVDDRSIKLVFYPLYDGEGTYLGCLETTQQAERNGSKTATQAFTSSSNATATIRRAPSRT